MINKLYILIILIILIILVFIIIKIQVYFKTVENFAYGIECVNNYIFSIQDNTISKQQDGDYHYLEFLHTGGNQTTYTLTLYNDILCDILIVGGGGGGSDGNADAGWDSKFGGGGGGGGVVYLVNQLLNAGTYKINVGRGGNSNDNGKDSSITYNDDTYVTLDSIQLQGKGGGKGWRRVGGEDSFNRGSGGGAKKGGTVGTQGLTFWNGTTCEYEYGGHEATSSRSGGGAGAPATAYGAGIGREVNITNESLYFGGGGQGARIQEVIQGGGGGGGIGRNGSSGFNGMPNTGGGGGGGFGMNGSTRSFPGGRGGSGIVIIRFLHPLHPLDDYNQHIVLWHDSQNIDGQNNTTLADGQLITDWFDKSGSGFTTTSTNPPEFNESENALYFNGNIIVTNINLNSYLTLNIFFVWKPTVPNELLHGLWSAKADLYNRCFWISGQEFDWFHDTPAPPNLIVGSGRDHEVTVHEQEEDFITNNIYIVNTEYNRVLQPGKVYINNNEKATFTSGYVLDTGTTDPSSANYSPSTTFGMARTKFAKADDFFMYGNIYEIIVINRLLTNAERLQIYNYLNDRCRR